MDHYGGIKSILEHKQAADDIKIVAPEGFLQHALAETVMTGNVMSRRALYMGGTDKILANAQIDYDNGEYRWVAQVVNHVLYADPNNQQARQLQANALEQLGYQAESARVQGQKMAQICIIGPSTCLGLKLKAKSYIF